MSFVFQERLLAFGQSAPMVGIGFGLAQHLTQQFDLTLQARISRFGLVLKAGWFRFRRPVRRPVLRLERKGPVQLCRIYGVMSSVILGRTHTSSTNSFKQGRFRATAGLSCLVQRQRHRWFPRVVKAGRSRFSRPVSDQLAFMFLMLIFSLVTLR